MRTSANSASSSCVIGPARSTSMPPLARRDHGRFDAVFSRATINNERDASRQFLHHMTRRGRADTSEAIGARRRERLAEGAHHLCEKRIRAYSNRNRFKARGHDRRHDFPARENNCQRAGPEFRDQTLDQRPFFFIDHRHPFQPRQLWQVDDQRIEMRALFCLENLYHRFGGKGVRRQAVDRLGRQGDDFARSQQIDRPRHCLPAIVRRVCRSDLRFSS